MILKITTHSGDEFTVEETEKSITEINKERNDTGIEGVLIGGCSFSRIDLKNIIPHIENK